MYKVKEFYAYHNMAETLVETFKTILLNLFPASAFYTLKARKVCMASSLTVLCD